MKRKTGKVRPPKILPKKKSKAEPPEENSRMPMCRVCDHRHSGVAHIWR